MDQLGVGFERPDRIEDRWQLLVPDIDQLGRPFGHLGVSRNDGSDLLADEADAILGEDEPVLHVEPKLVWEVLAGDDLGYTWHRFRRRYVDALDQRVGEGALDDLRVQ